MDRSAVFALSLVDKRLSIEARSMALDVRRWLSLVAVRSGLLPEKVREPRSTIIRSSTASEFEGRGEKESPVSGRSMSEPLLPGPSACTVDGRLPFDGGALRR
jgi:hypothetical protein